MISPKGLIKIFLNLTIYLGLIALYAVIFNLKFDLVGVAFLLVALQSAVFVSVCSEDKVNLGLVYFVFSFVFLNLLPWLHYSSQILIWRSTALVDRIYVEVNVLLFLTNSIVFYINRIKVKYSSQSRVQNYILINWFGKSFLLILSVIGFFVTLAINDFSILNLFFRGLIEENRNSPIESSALLLLLTLCARMLTFFTFVFAATQIEKSTILKSCLFVLLLITIFPTGVARFMVGMVYLPIAMIYFPILRSGRVFAASLILSLVLVFPFLDQFRYFAEWGSINLIPSVDYFYAAHFDAYENLATAISSNFVTYGWQLLGVMLFYVPRLYWDAKPVGSGQQMADDQGYIFNNISMPYLGEGYINFGILGLFMFALILAYAMRRLDAHYRYKVFDRGGVDFSTAFYFYLLGSLFFILRGDLLSSVAYFSSGVFVAYFVMKSMKFFAKK